VPIRSYLNGIAFDPETIEVLGVAFDKALQSLRLVDRTDLATELLAKRMIEVAQQGERDPERLCERTLQRFRTQDS
jgi:hypothetical protein